MLTDFKLVAFAATAIPNRAKAFYSTVLGFTLVADTPFSLVFDAGGTTLRIQKVQTVNASEYTVLGWEISDMVATVESLVAKGVLFERYTGLQQDQLGIWETPDGAKVAWFKDPDGNLLSITQNAC